MAVHGITNCKKEYQILNEDVPDISRITSDHLDLAIRVCNDISYKSITSSLETSALEKNEIYLLNWHKALDRDRIRLERFIVKLIKERCEISNLRYLQNKTIIEGLIKKPEQNYIRTFNLQVYPYAHKVVFTIKDLTAYYYKMNPDIKGTNVKHHHDKKLEVITPKPAIDKKIIPIKPHIEKKVKVIIDNNEFLLYERKN